MSDVTCISGRGLLEAPHEHQLADKLVLFFVMQLERLPGKNGHLFGARRVLLSHLTLRYTGRGVRQPLHVDINYVILWFPHTPQPGGSIIILSGLAYTLIDLGTFQSIPSDDA